MKSGGGSLAAFGIGAKLRQERVGKGLAIDDIARDTRIATRFLEAIETDDYSSLPGLVFTRNFVRQYALTLHLDPDPLVAELPKPDESTVPLPNPPARPRSSYRRDRRLRLLQSSIAGLVLICGAGVTAYVRFNRLPRTAAPAVPAVQIHAPAAALDLNSHTANPAPTSPAAPLPTRALSTSAAGPVQVSLTAHER